MPVNRIARQGGISASTRSRRIVQRSLAASSNRRWIAAALSVAGTIITAGGVHTALGDTVVSSDTQYNFQNTVGTFSTGFTPTFTTDTNGELNFGGTTYTATDDLATASANALNFFSSGLITVAPSVAGNVLTLTNNTAGQAPSITVGSGGATISTTLAGTNGFSKNGSGILTLQTNADTISGNIFVNAGTLALNIGQNAGAVFILNNGAAVTTTQGLTNVINALAGSSTYTSTAASNSRITFTGNGNILWSGNGNDSTGNANMFTGFGGTITWATNHQFRNTGTYSGVFATLDFAATSGNIYVNGSRTYVLGGLASSGNSNNIQGPNNSGAAGTNIGTYIIGSANGNTTYSGGITVTTPTSGSNSTNLLKVGVGTFTMTDVAGTVLASASPTGSSTFSANGGTLKLDYTNAPAGILQSNTSLSFGGGILDFQGKTTGSTSQTTGAVVVAAGGGSLLVDPHNGSGTTLNLGTLTTSLSAGGTLNIQPTALTANNGSGAATINTTSTTANLTLGIFSPRITFGGDWATTTTATTNNLISAYANYTDLTTTIATTNDTTNDRLNNVGNATMSGNLTTNSLKITNSTSQSLDLGGNTLQVTSGGLLFTGSAAYSIGIGTTANAGTLKSNSATNSDLIIQQLGTGNLTINSVIAPGIGTTTLTKAGSGTLTLTGTNTYTGSTFLNGGITNINAAANLGAPAAASTITLDGGTLQAAVDGITLAGGSTGGLKIGGGGGTFDDAGSINLTITGVISTLTANQFGPLIKTGSGTLTLNGANTYQGATIIRGGILSTASITAEGAGTSGTGLGSNASGIGQSNNTAPALVLDGGTLQYAGAAATGATTDRSFTVTSNGGALDASGSGGAGILLYNPSRHYRKRHRKPYSDAHRLQHQRQLARPCAGRPFIGQNQHQQNRSRQMGSEQHRQHLYR